MAGSFERSWYRNPNTDLLESGYIPDYWVEGVEPSVSSKSGTFTNGSIITLTGTNFSKKNTTQSWFADFSGDTVGQRAADLTYWNSIAGAEYLVDDTKDQPIGSRCVFVDADDQDIKTIHWQFPANQDEVYFEAWCKCNRIRFHQPNTWSSGTTYAINERVNQIKPAGGGAGSVYDFHATAASTGQSPFNPDGTVNTTYWAIYEQPQVKSFRIVDGTGETSAQGRPVGISSILESENFVLASTEDGGLSGAQQHAGYAAFPSSSTWAKHTFYVKRGDLDVANGKAYCKIGTTAEFRLSSHPAGGHMASPSGAMPASLSLYDGTPFANNETGETNQGLFYRRILLPYYQRNWQRTAVGVAFCYANNSQERVVIGDASTWNACDHSKTYTCPQVSRDNNQIQFTAYTSTMLTGALWAYVVNRDGLHSTNGIQVRA